MRPLPRATRVAATLAACFALIASSALLPAPASARSVVTPGNFTGYGFDQCTAPTQKAMDRWLTSSPYWAVGIYVSGDSRGCVKQPNLTPTWVRTQLARGWRLLPITLGPQAWCTTRERYLHQVRINPSSTSSYGKARAQGRAEAAKTVGAARRLGIGRGSTLWYDLEAFNTAKTACRESALSFLSAWTNKMHALGYVSGVYSSAASGIRILDSARANRPGTYAMPDQLWIADWNRRADVNTSYIGNKGWMPHKRVHQYRGGHNETHGGVTINIDNNWVDLGKGSRIAREPRHCRGAATYNLSRYPYLSIGSKGTAVRTLQCFLKSKHAYRGTVDGVYDKPVGAAVRAYRVKRGFAASTTMSPGVWTAMVSVGAAPLQKYGAASIPVRRLQRGLNAADRAGLEVTGIFEGSTTTAVKRYQRDHKMAATGVVTTAMWDKLFAGVR
jgi:peptidoglycan hydrolase-like protein with peptidoglycan-binding domain